MGDLSLFAPEAVVLLGALLAFACSAFGASEGATWLVSVLVAIAALAVTGAWIDAQGEPFFEGIYQVDTFSQVLKLGIALGLLLTLLVSRDLASTREHARGDMPIFLFVSAVGLMMLVSATELLTLYVALELSAYGLYIMAALHRSERMGGEAGAKYILFGAAASAVSLYGISLIFGVAKTTYLADLMALGPLIEEPLFLIGLLLLLSGFLFKLAVFPFHAWAADTYQGAPHQAVTFIGTASKVAAVGVLLRALAFTPDKTAMIQALMVLSVVSMTFGNLAAIAQRDFKRLLAYSTIAHAGYVLIGLIAFNDTGVASAIFYVLVYVALAFCAFLVVCAVGQDGTNPSRDDLAGLYKRSPFLSLVLLVGMFGLAGIPPTPGFAGKWFLFSAALEAGMFWLVLIAAINSTVSLYYYLSIVKVAYLAPSDERPPVKLPASYVLAAYGALGLVVFIGFYPGPLWDLATAAAQALTGVAAG